MSRKPSADCAQSSCLKKIACCTGRWWGIWIYCELPPSASKVDWDSRSLSLLTIDDVLLKASGQCWGYVESMTDLVVRAMQDSPRPDLGAELQGRKRAAGQVRRIGLEK